MGVQHCKDCFRWQRNYGAYGMNGMNMQYQMVPEGLFRPKIALEFLKDSKGLLQSM
jgi:hypothetical protein